MADATVVMKVDRRVVRRLGYHQTHVVEAGRRQRWTSSSFLGADFRCLGAPAIAECGVTLRDRDGLLVLMKPGTPVHCAACRRLSGMVEAPENNTA